MGPPPKYLVTVDGARAVPDQKFALYPGTSLVYVLVVTKGPLRWAIPRRFSEIKRFWEALRPVAAAAGAPLSNLSGQSAFMSGTGYTGNLYETDPNSTFAAQRVKTVKALMAELSTRLDAAGGQLFGLKQVREFFDMDVHEAPEDLPRTARSAPTDESRRRRHLGLFPTVLSS